MYIQETWLILAVKLRQKAKTWEEHGELKLVTAGLISTSIFEQVTRQSISGQHPLTSAKMDPLILYLPALSLLEAFSSIPQFHPFYLGIFVPP